MDFTPELIALQGAIASADCKHSFTNLTCRGGNEQSLQNVSEILRKFLVEKDYLTNEGVPEKNKSIIRKICFYIVLNSDFRALDTIVELDTLGHLVWTTPTLTTCLFCEIVLKLQLENYIGEVITYSCPRLGTEILKSLVNGIRYCSAQESIDKLKVLAIATYHSLCRLSFFNYDSVITTSLLSDLYTYFLRIITHFVSPPNNGKLDLLPENEKYIYLGKSFHALLNTVLDCLNIFHSHLNFDSDQFDLYTSTVSLEMIKTKCLPNSVKDNSDSAVLEYLHKCNNAVLDKCVEIVMKVSVDVFCCWSEHTEDGKSLQRLVGESCYRLHQILEVSPDLSIHTVVSMLPQLSCKPPDIFDIIQGASENDLITNAQTNSPDQEHWLNAIIEKNNLFDSDELTGCLLESLAFLKPEACEQLFKKSLTNLQQNCYHNKNAKSLAAKCFVGIDPGKKCNLMVDVFPNKMFHSSLMQPEFQHNMNEVFNKLIATSDSGLSDVFDVFIQSPFNVLEKMVNIGIENLKQANLVIGMIATLKQFSEHHCDGGKHPAILTVVEDLCSTPLETETQENSFIILISGICKECPSLKTSLLLEVLMPYVYKFLLNKDYRALKLYLAVVRSSYDVEDLMPYRAPTLVMLGQVLDIVRWDLKSYAMDAPGTVQEALDILNPMMSSYSSIIPAKEVYWLKIKLKNLTPLNMYYYRQLWKPLGSNFIEVITNQQKIKVDDYPSILAKILFSCTPKEWTQIWLSLIEEMDHNTAFDVLYEAMLKMSAAEVSRRSDNSHNCIRYCYRCFTCVVKEQFVTDSSNEDQVAQVLEKFVGIANALSEQDVEDVEMILMPLLASVAVKNSRAPYIETVNKLKNGKLAKLVERLFTDT